MTRRRCFWRTRLSLNDLQAVVLEQGLLPNDMRTVCYQGVTSPLMARKDGQTDTHTHTKTDTKTDTKTNTKTNTKTGRQTDGQTDRQTKRQRDAHTHTHTHKDKHKDEDKDRHKITHTHKDKHEDKLHANPKLIVRRYGLVEHINQNQTKTVHLSTALRPP